MKKDNNLLKEYYDQFLNEEDTPSFIWENIVQKLDTVEQDADLLQENFDTFYEGDELDPAIGLAVFDQLEELDGDLLQQNFDVFYKDEEPVPNAWAKLEETLEIEDASLLKDNFDGFYASEQVDIQVWENIQDKLDIHKTWMDLQPKLDKAALWYRWKTRIKRLGAAAMLLLLLRTCVGDFGNNPTYLSIFDSSKHTQSTEKTVLNKPAIPSLALIPTTGSNTLEKNSNSPAQKENQEEKVVLDYNKTTQNTNSKEHLSNSPKLVPSQQKKNNSLLADSPKQQKNLISLSGNNKGDAIVEKNASKEEKSFDTATLPDSEESNSEKASNHSLENNASNTTIAKNITSNDHVDNSDNQNTSPQNTIQDYNEPIQKQNAYNFELLALANIEALEEEKIQWPLVESIPFSLEKSKKSSLARFPKFELGLIGKMGSNLLLNEMSSEGFRYHSLQETKLHFGGNIGFIAALKISSKDAITLQVSPYALARQSQGFFSAEGVYNQQEIKLSYLDFSLGYERDVLVFHSSAGERVASVFARIDLGLSYLTLEEITLNKETLPQDAFKKLNIATSLALGSKYHIKRFTIDYGVYGTIGLNDINNNNIFGPQTNLVSFGGFLGIRYQL